MLVTSFWHSGILAFWHSGILAFWHSGILAFWHSGILAFWHSGGFRALALRRFIGDAANNETGCDLRYQGQLYDAESGLYYNRHRYYDPEIGQYISPDPIGLGGGLRPQGYVHNQVEWVDPFGLAEYPSNLPMTAEVIPCLCRLKMMTIRPFIFTTLMAKTLFWSLPHFSHLLTGLYKQD